MYAMPTVYYMCGVRVLKIHEIIYEIFKTCYLQKCRPSKVLRYTVLSVVKDWVQ